LRHPCRATSEAVGASANSRERSVLDGASEEVAEDGESGRRVVCSDQSFEKSTLTRGEGDGSLGGEIGDAEDAVDGEDQVVETRGVLSTDAHRFAQTGWQ
jgi:hypothetical protein